MLSKIISFADRYDMFPSSGAVLVGVSGGADSMALLEALLEISQKRGFSVCAAHFNHMLRGDESSRDEAFVREHCAVRGVPLYAKSGDVKALASKRKLSIEEAARDMRYGFFCSVSEKIGAERIATAHTADDNIETMIMNLARGAGTAGLSGIPPTREIHNSRFTIHNSGAPSSPTLNSCAALPRIIRPMLRVTREEVLRFISERGIPFVEDSTNGLDAFTRNKVRLKAIPVIREINPKYAEAAAAAAEILRADDEYLSALADEFIENHCTPTTHNSQLSTLNSPLSTLNSPLGRFAPAVDAGELAKLPFAVSGCVIRKLCGGRATYGHVKAVLELCKKNEPSAFLSLPGTVVYRENDRIAFSGDVEAEADGFAQVCPSDGDKIEIPGLGMELSCISVECNDILHLFNKSVTSFLLKKDDICGIITVRPRREGDRIRLFGQKGTKTLKKLFIERRIPARKRSLVPVIADDMGVLAVYGIGAGDRAAPGPGDKAFQISFEMQGAGDREQGTGNRGQGTEMTRASR